MIKNSLGAALICAACLAPSHAQSLSDAQFVNGLAIAGDTLDLSTGSVAERRVGFFSDLYYDRGSNSWWGLSDRGPGGGLLNYETRMQRFALDVSATGQISNFRLLETVKFTRNGSAFNGMAPNPTSVLGQAFDPEGVVINPLNGHFLVSDEYGPSLYEFDRSGQYLRSFATPENLVPRSAASGTPNFASDSGNTAGKRTNRGFEGLAISADGRYAYATLQSAMLDEGGGNGVYNRIVKFDTSDGNAVAQYAYQMDGSGQGRGVSALVALGNDRFLMLERNNRGIGVGATLSPPDKDVYLIDLATASNVAELKLPATGALPGGATAVTKISRVIDLAADTLPELGGVSPEKWEGVAIGPQLADGRYLVLAGTDNDYSVTQSGSGDQFDVWFRFSDADPFASAIQCPIGQTVGCTGVLTADHQLLPGVLHAYTARVDGYLAPVPESGTWALWLAGLAGVGARCARPAGKRT